jgi:hypothetical protein
MDTHCSSLDTSGTFDVLTVGHVTALSVSNSGLFCVAASSMGLVGVFPFHSADLDGSSPLSSINEYNLGGLVGYLRFRSPDWFSWGNSEDFLRSSV